MKGKGEGGKGGLPLREGKGGREEETEEKGRARRGGEGGQGRGGDRKGVRFFFSADLATLKPPGKFDISGIVIIFFAKFTTLTEEASSHILCKFRCNIWLRAQGRI